jgi:hypothetical protein
MKTAKIPTTNEGIKKMQHLHRMEFYSAIKKMKFCHMHLSGWNWRTYILH